MRQCLPRKCPDGLTPLDEKNLDYQDDGVFSDSLKQTDPCRGCERKWHNETDFCMNHCRDYVQYLIAVMVDLKCFELRRSIDAIQNPSMCERLKSRECGDRG